MIAIVDYGVGNLFSLTASMKYIGTQTKVTGNKQDLKDADKIILPGVGAFGDAIGKLEDSGLVETIIEETAKGKYMLGICLGMQLLFENGYEYGKYQGLGLVPGDVVSLEEPETQGLKIPHIGWNSLDMKEDPIFKYNNQGDYVYYVHSFYGKNCEESTIATSKYGVTVTGAVRRGSVYGTQFHPEKSGEAGIKILKAFAEL